VSVKCAVLWRCMWLAESTGLWLVLTLTKRCGLWSWQLVPSELVFRASIVFDVSLYVTLLVLPIYWLNRYVKEHKPHLYYRVVLSCLCLPCGSLVLISTV
jgi:hypothetical protein